MSEIFRGLFDSETTVVISPGTFLLCIGVSLVLGFIIAFCSGYRTNYSRNYYIALTVLPPIVCILIMMVNGNIGAGVAIAGAFALVRFRSSQGDARQITLVFLAMASGLIVGMGYLAYAALFTLILCLAILFFGLLWSKKGTQADRIIRITIPEDLDYEGVFDPVLTRYTGKYELLKVNTSNMGSLFKLTYKARISDCAKEKALIDELRCRNGNLEVAILNADDSRQEL